MADIIERLTEIAALHDRIEAEQAIPAYPSERELLREAAQVIKTLCATLQQIASDAEKCPERYMTFVPICARASAASDVLASIGRQHGYSNSFSEND